MLWSDYLYMSVPGIQKSYDIAAHYSNVWDALINPDLINQYYFNSEVTTDWKMGSPIRYVGTIEGKPFYEEGVIEEFVSDKRLILRRSNNVLSEEKGELMTVTN